MPLAAGDEESKPLPLLQTETEPIPSRETRPDEGAEGCGVTCMTRTFKQRDIDRLAVGERVFVVDGVCVLGGTVARIGHNFTYRDHTTPLGYYVAVDEQGGGGENFYSRHLLYRQTPVERDEMLEHLMRSRDVLDYEIGRLRESVKAVSA
jgi:hypothetical protein